MNRRKRTGLFLTYMAIISTWAVLGCGADFEIEVLSSPIKQIPGVVSIIRAEANNISGHPITVPWRGGNIQIEVLDDKGERTVPCRPTAFSDLTEPLPRDWRGSELETGWSAERVDRLCFDSPGTYSIRYFLESRGPYRNRNGEIFHAWEGEVSSETVTVVVRAPEGVDLEVFEAFDGDLDFSILGGERPGEILRRFPTSTYAAYIVWETFARDTLCWKSDDLLLSLNTGIPKGSQSAPCNRETCMSNGWMRLSGREYIEYRSGLFETLLKHHADIWFADEIRLKLALDRYLLGDPGTATAELEFLAEHGGPLAAKKCRELLATMKARGMLKGGSPMEEGVGTANTE